MSNGKVIIIHLIVGLIKKIWCDSIGCNYIKISRFFPKLYKPFSGGIKVKLDLSDYARKTDLKNVAHTDGSIFALKQMRQV